MSDLIRSFIAVEIEDREVLNKIIRIRDMIASLSGEAIKIVEDENIHLTIRFLGEIDRVVLENIKKILDEVRNFKRFSIHVKNLGAFPNISRPRVIWVGIEEGFEELKRIRRFIDEKTLGLRIYADQHDFQPHITIARVKTSLPPKASQILLNYSSEDFGYSPVTKVVLKKSHLTPRGPIYTDLYTVELS